MERERENVPLPDPYFEDSQKKIRFFQGDSLVLLAAIPEESVDLIFADPPYFLSNGGITCHAGRMVSVNKGKWDKSSGPRNDHAFSLAWLSECRRILKPNGTTWVSGTSHGIHSVGYAMQCLGYKLLNDITWVKKNPPPNLSCRYFTHSTETLIWASKGPKSRHKFNYRLMREIAGGKQMKSVWVMDAPTKPEKKYGKHPAQKPIGLLERILLASSDEGDVFLDPFLGSGTSAVVAVKRNRKFRGIELDPKWLDIAIKRVGDEIDIENSLDFDQSAEIPTATAPQAT
jgi:site-specific DNA-methyltransferase (adenine-specific)